MSAKTIWKFELGPQTEQFLRLPRGSRILTAQMQGGKLCFWALVDPRESIEERRIQVVGTGHKAPPLPWAYFATVQMALGEHNLVWHLFEYPAEEKR